MTGASRGIGGETVRELLKESACVVGVSRTGSAEEDTDGLGGDYIPMRADISNAAQVRELFQRIRRDIGLVSALVNAAGVARFGETLSASDEDWDLQIRVNLTGTYLCDVESIRHMLEAGGGDIVNVLSMAATTALPESAAYTASKAGALGLTRSLSAEYRRRGVRICALLPGATDTPLWEGIAPHLDRTRMLRAQDVAQTIVWILKQPPSASVDELCLMPRDGVL